MAETHQDHVRIAVLETQIANLQASIQHQAVEYARRLDELNHAHERAAQDKSKFITGDLFYAKYDEQQKWRSDMDQWRSRIIGIGIGIGLAGGAAGGGIAGLVLQILR